MQTAKTIRAAVLEFKYPGYKIEGEPDNFALILHCSRRITFVHTPLERKVIGRARCCEFCNPDSHRVHEMNLTTEKAIAPSNGIQTAVEHEITLGWGK
jgi:hypothetical protein